jgi:hypothetical protein
MTASKPYRPAPTSAVLLEFSREHRDHVVDAAGRIKYLN